MNKSQHFVYQRGQATLDVQEQIAADWIWSGKTIAEWEAELDAIDTQDTATANAQAEEVGARGVVDNTLGILFRKNQQALSMLRTKYRSNEAKLVLLEGLEAKAGGRALVLENARNFEPRWELVDPTFAPVPTNTLAIFKTTRQQAITELNALTKAEVVAKEEEEALEKLITALNDACVAFYSDAVHVFPENTPQGQLIRTKIPTSYDPTPLPDKAVISEMAFTAPMAIRFRITSDHASKFDIYEKSPTAADFVLIDGDYTESLYEMTLTDGNGLYVFKVVPKNSEGNGPESDPSSVTAPGTP